MENEIKNIIDRRLGTLSCSEELFQKIQIACEAREGQNHKARRKGRKKAVILLIAVISMLTLLGAGVYHKYYKKTVSVTTAAEPESKEADAWRTIHMETDKHGSASTMSPFHPADSDTVISIFNNSNNKLLYPSYIPAGYSFIEADLSFYLTPDMMESKPVSSEKEDGLIRETYVVSETLQKNVESAKITYQNDKGDTFDFYLRLSADDKINLDAGENTVADMSSETGFADSGIYRRLDKSVAGYIIEEITGADYVWARLLGIKFREDKYGYRDPLARNLGDKAAIKANSGTYKYSSYTMIASSLSRDELIKIMKNLR